MHATRLHESPGGIQTFGAFAGHGVRVAIHEVLRRQLNFLAVRLDAVPVGLGIDRREGPTAATLTLVPHSTHAASVFLPPVQTIRHADLSQRFSEGTHALGELRERVKRETHPPL